MQFLLDASKYIVDHYQEIIVAGNALFAGLIAVCLLIPGEQPEKFLQSLVDFISKFSKK